MVTGQAELAVQLFQHEGWEVFAWLLAGSALILALISLAGEGRRAAYYERKLPDQRQTSHLPRVTLIVPVKGPDEGLRENLASLASLDYPHYELIVVAGEASDIPPGVVPPGARIVLAGTGDAAGSEKISNLIAAVGHAASETEVFAFADSDGRVSRGWLRALVAPLADVSVGVATGYRFYLPDPPDLWSLLRSVWNAAIFGGFGPGRSQFAWGGAMALRKEVFFRARVVEFWQGSVSDDYRLTAAIRAAGLGVRFAPGAVVAGTDHTTARQFLLWVRRQLVITRVYCPKLWRLSFAVTLAYCGGMAACVALALHGRMLGGVMLAVLLSLWTLKAVSRTRLARAALPEYGSWFDRYGRLLIWSAPPGCWIWLCAHLASMSSNRIEWRGIRYRLSERGIQRL